MKPIVRRSVQPRHPASLVPMLAFPVLPVLLPTLVGCVKPPPPQPTFSLASPARQAFTDQAIYQSTLESIANVPLAAMVLAVLAVLLLVLGRRAAAHAGNAMAQPSLERALAVVLVAAGCGAWGETVRQLAGIARASDSEG